MARDGQRLPAIIEALSFAAPGLPVLELPAWDCLPYDRVSPGSDAAAKRLDALTAMIALAKKPHRAVILTTANALLQRIPPAELVEAQTFHARPGNQIDMNALVSRLETSGFERVPTVRGIGEFAVRGGILDLFAPGWTEALRLDFFGDTLESIRVFDAATQRTTGQRKSMALQAMSEVALTPETISRFRRSYIEAFGAPQRDDPLYAAVSEGRRFAGMEHWLPFFYERLETVFDYLPDTPVVFDHLAHEALAERHTLILDHYEARRKQADGALKDAVPYKPVPPDLLYLSPEDLIASLGPREAIDFTPFDAPDAGAKKVFHAGSRHGRSFVEERADPNVNVFDVVVRHIADERAARRRIVIAGWTEGSLDRLGQILAEHHLGNLKQVADAGGGGKARAGQAALGRAAAGIRLRDRKTGRHRRTGHSRRPADPPLEAQEARLRFHCRSLGALGRRHRRPRRSRHRPLHRPAHHRGGRRAARLPRNPLCRRRPAVPAGRKHRASVALRLGSAEATLDKLGGGAWQSRKARLKKRLRDMAGQLIRIAAERQMRAAPALVPAEGLYDEFAARFPYEETEDQQTAIDSVRDDLAAGKPMDRLICGDVGFGKTEVALRAAFVAAMEGFQVAVVVPTTLLSRQHFKTFSERFPGLPIRVAQASRLVGAKELAETKKGIADGQVDIVVGTHALLGSAIAFKNLGLLIIDEEQHFRRQAQGAAEGPEGRRPRADAVGDADPAHAATGADRACANCR